MKNNFIARFFARFLRTTKPVLLLPEHAGMDAPKPAKSQQLTNALTGLNDEFVTLNYKLLELKDALGTLRDALKQLEEANRRRAETRAMLSVNRADLN